MPTAIADEIDTFGEDLNMLEFREIPLGMHMPVVLLTEEARGLKPNLLYYEALSDIPEFGNAAYEISGVEIFGRAARVEYTFSYNRFKGVLAFVSFENLEDAQSYFDSAFAALEEKYGSFNNMSVETAFEGFDLPEGEDSLKDSEIAFFIKSTDVDLIDGYKYPAEYISYSVGIVLDEAEGGYEVRFGLGGGYKKTDDGDGEIRYDGPWAN